TSAPPKDIGHRIDPYGTCRSTYSNQRGGKQLRKHSAASDTYQRTLRSTHTLVGSLVGSLVGGRFQLGLAPDQAGQSSEQAEQLNEPVFYRLARGVKSVIEVWTGYTKGVVGCIPVQQHEARHGAKWRSSFYDAIQFLAASEHVPPETIAQVEETKRKNVSLTLDALRQKLSGKGGAIAVFQSA
ncbi:Transcriptional activator of glycolytic enzyme, partial [Phytophthora infestans]